MKPSQHSVRLIQLPFLPGHFAFGRCGPTGGGLLLDGDGFLMRAETTGEGAHRRTPQLGDPVQLRQEPSITTGDDHGPG